MSDYVPSQPFEDQVWAACAVPAPDAEFVSRLRVDLTERAATLPKANQHRRVVSSRTLWVGILTLIAVLVGTTLVIGPQRVWAAVQGLLGYIPGVGIVPVDGAMGLVEPFEYTHNGITLRVERLISTSEHSYLTCTVQGLPDREKAYIAHLELPDGIKYFSNNSSVGMIWGENGNPISGGYQIVETFYSIPKGIRQVTLVWGRREREDKDPFETWIIPLHIRPLSDEARVMLYPTAYTPEAAADTQHDITLQVLQVAPGKDQTIINLSLQWPEDLSPIDMTEIWSSSTPIQLVDESGWVYQESTTGSAQSVQPVVVKNDPSRAYSTESLYLAFEPLQPGVHHLTLHVPDLWFRASQWPAKLHVEMGPNAQFGDSWPLDTDLQVADQKIHIRGARRVDKLNYDRKSRAAVLELLVDPLPAESWIRVNFIEPQGNTSYAVNYSVDQETGEYMSGMILTPEQLQSGSVDFILDYVEGSLSGPWEITWNQPKN